MPRVLSLREDDVRACDCNNAGPRAVLSVPGASTRSGVRPETQLHRKLTAELIELFRQQG